MTPYYAFVSELLACLFCFAIKSTKSWCIEQPMQCYIDKHQVEMAKERISHRQCERGMCDVCTLESTSELCICTENHLTS